MRVEIYCSQDAEKVNFDRLSSHREEIERLFPGETISWERLDGKLASRVAVYRSYDEDKVATPSRARRNFLLDHQESLVIP